MLILRVAGYRGVVFARPVAEISFPLAAQGLITSVGLAV